MNNISRRSSSVASLRMLVVPAAVVVAATTAFGQSSELPVIEITGVVRDFRPNGAPGGHPDFEVQPEEGFGVYTANVAQALRASGKPKFTGQGAHLVEPFRNAAEQPIAPHLFNRRFECQIVGPEQECVRLTHPSGGQLGYSTYEVCFIGVEFNDDGTSSWRYQVNKIEGTNLSHWTLWLDESVEVVESETTPGGAWIGDSHPSFPGPGWKWEGFNGANPGEFVIVLNGHYFGTNESWVEAKGGGGGQQYAQAPFFGPGPQLSTNNSPYEHTWELVPDSDLEDLPGEFYGLGTGGITSAQTFDQWFSDVPGVNMSAPLTLRFVRQSAGNYVFDDSLDGAYAALGGFFPINDKLLGGSPNHHFTWEMHANFTFDSAKHSYISVTSTDDMWVFINGLLVIDLGGVHGPAEQRFDLNRMCLNNGQQCKIAIFIVDRHTPNSNVRIDTDIELEGLPVPAVTALYD